jgi:hypothetical protein
MGFGPFPVGLVRAVVGVLGIIYLVVGLLGFVVPSLFGLIPHGYTVFDDLLHLALGRHRERADVSTGLFTKCLEVWNSANFACSEFCEVRRRFLGALAYFVPWRTYTPPG